VSIIGDSGSEPNDSGSESMVVVQPAVDALLHVPAGNGGGEGLRRRLLDVEPDPDVDMSSSFYCGDAASDLPANLVAFRPEKKYVHTPNKKLSVVLNLVAALVVVLVVGLGVGHFLGGFCSIFKYGMGCGISHPW
jgi:hypothetical protein